MNFTSIEKFHGTGAFNQTKFPQWDSIFLDFMNRPSEVIVMKVRQRRRQRKLSGFNPYVESLSRNSIKKKNVASVKTPSYLPSATAGVVGTGENKPTGKLPGHNSYLNSLSASLSSETKEFSIVDSSRKDPEIFQRRLLSTRLKLLRRQQTGRSSAKDDAEAFQRRLLAARLKLQNARYGTFKIDGDDNNKRDVSLSSSGIKKGCDSYAECSPTPPAATARTSGEKKGKQGDGDSKNPYLHEVSVPYCYLPLFRMFMPKLIIERIGICSTLSPSPLLFLCCAYYILFGIENNRI